jgi:hypothetical protein
LRASSIEFGGDAIDCIVRNISETGAALEALSPLYIPDRFTLFVQADQLKRRCRVVWRKKDGSASRSTKAASVGGLFHFRRRDD